MSDKRTLIETIIQNDMLKLSIPGFKENLSLRYLVLDFNGTLAVDGKLIKGVKKELNDLSKTLDIHVLTGDSFGTARKELKGIKCKINILPKENQAKEKEKYIKKFGPESVIAIGNGRNDYFMLKLSAIGIILVQDEGASAETLGVADVVCKNILSALELLKHPLRLSATLRS
ncbi:MAG TPA: ATPase P [Bacteroidia bacterium]|nr:ATPase P [Bacteroidia bacterium]